MGAENTLLSDDIQDFVRSDEAARMLSSGIVKSPFPDVSLSALSVQIKGFLKSKKQAPQALLGQKHPVPQRHIHGAMLRPGCIVLQSIDSASWSIGS